LSTIVIQRIENLAELEDLVSEIVSTSNLLQRQIERLRNFEIRIQTREMEITHMDTQENAEKS